MFRDSYGEGSAVIRRVGWKYRDKLKKLRVECQNASDATFSRSNGSRKLFANNEEWYMKKENNGEITGAPFPKNMRQSRRNRPHRRNAPENQEYVVTADDIEEEKILSLLQTRLLTYLSFA